MAQWSVLSPHEGWLQLFPVFVGVFFLWIHVTALPSSCRDNNRGLRTITFTVYRGEPGKGGGNGGSVLHLLGRAGSWQGGWVFCRRGRTGWVMKEQEGLWEAYRGDMGKWGGMWVDLNLVHRAEIGLHYWWNSSVGFEVKRGSAGWKVGLGLGVNVKVFMRTWGGGGQQYSWGARKELKHHCTPWQQPSNRLTYISEY